MATPLTLYVPIKQDQASQKAAQLTKDNFASGIKIELDEVNLVHYARIALVPNPSIAGKPPVGFYAILVIIEFDGDMSTYLQFFWNKGFIQAAFKGVAAIALVAPYPEVTTEASFEKFIDDNNLNMQADMYMAYPQTVIQIKHLIKPV